MKEKYLKMDLCALGCHQRCEGGRSAEELGAGTVFAPVHTHWMTVFKRTKRTLEKKRKEK
jgi:hypothetical protein